MNETTVPLVTLQRQISKMDFSQTRSVLYRTCIMLHFNSSLRCCVYFWNEGINNSNSDNTPGLLCSELQRRCHSKDLHGTARTGISCDLSRVRQWEDGASDSQQLSDLDSTVWKCVYIYTIYCSALIVYGITSIRSWHHKVFCHNRLILEVE